MPLGQWSNSLWSEYNTNKEGTEETRINKMREEKVGKVYEVEKCADGENDRQRGDLVKN